MQDIKKTCKIAVVQAAPVMFDKKKSLEKVISLIETCQQQQAEFIVFPELCIPGYPYGMSFGFSVGARDAGGRRDWKQYYDNSVVVPGPETKQLGEAARRAKAWISVGISERDVVTATLYNSNLLFSPQIETDRLRTRCMGRCRSGIFSCRTDAMGTGWQFNLLGKLHAFGTGRIVSKRHYHIHRAEYQ